MKFIATIDELELFLGMELKKYAPKLASNHQGLRISNFGTIVRNAIKLDDSDAVKIACAILLKDPALPFGKLIKSGNARTLRQHPKLLSPADQKAISKKTSQLLNLEFCPRETEDYCKLVKSWGTELSCETAEMAHPIATKSKFLKAYLLQPPALKQKN